ncbi:hypothetical protein Mapa_006137 [Marchantia paleacea]|nr:hypothetical protein Mapa_006137 [Marchantia paleacea]
MSCFDPSDPVLDPMWRQGMFAICFMTCSGITKSWGGVGVLQEKLLLMQVSGVHIWQLFAIGSFHVTCFGISISDPYGLTGKEQLVAPAWGAEGFHHFVPGGIASHHIAADILGI